MTDTTTIQAAGFIVCDDTAIWGYGATRAAAWNDMLREMAMASVQVVDEASDDMDGKTLASKFTALPATAALIAMVQDRGGNIAWGEVDGVCCTRDEEGEAA